MAGLSPLECVCPGIASPQKLQKNPKTPEFVFHKLLCTNVDVDAGQVLCMVLAAGLIVIKLMQCKGNAVSLHCVRFYMLQWVKPHI